MSHSEKEDSKKEKIRKRNLRNWMIFQQSETLRDNVDIGAPQTERKPGKSKKEGDEKIWSAQLVSIRNRLDRSQRLADDRWNRFAGTSDGGGRGR